MPSLRMRPVFATVALVAALVWNRGVWAQGGRVADPYWTLLRADDRTDADRQDDAGRNPLETLRFLAVKPGMRVADIGAGGGYMTELLVRTVGATGRVYGQNAKVVLEKVASKAWAERLARPINKSVVRVDREFDDPLPSQAKDLDLVVNAFTYHDAVWLGVDRTKMNRAIFRALRPGGRYIVLDHAARAGAGSNDAETLHRIEESVVVDEITKAGFQLVDRGAFLRNADDSKDKTVFGPLRGKTDRFVLAFVKPAS